MTGRRLFILGNSFSKPIPLNPFPFLYIPQFSRFTLLVYLTLSHQALGRIVATVEELDGLNQQIATAAEEQSQVAQDIDRNITNVSGLSEQAHEGTAAVLSANQRVKEHMAGLRVVLGRFRT